jgi:hypothetical protein
MTLALEFIGARVRPGTAVTVAVNHSTFQPLNAWKSSLIWVDESREGVALVLGIRTTAI